MHRKDAQRLKDTIGLVLFSVLLWITWRHDRIDDDERYQFTVAALVAAAVVDTYFAATQPMRTIATFKDAIVVLLISYHAAFLAVSHHYGVRDDVEVAVKMTTFFVLGVVSDATTLLASLGTHSPYDPIAAALPQPEHPHAPVARGLKRGGVGSQ